MNWPKEVKHRQPRKGPEKDIVEKIVTRTLDGIVQCISYYGPIGPAQISRRISHEWLRFFYILMRESGRSLSMAWSMFALTLTWAAFSWVLVKADFSLENSPVFQIRPLIILVHAILILSIAEANREHRDTSGQVMKKAGIL